MGVIRHIPVDMPMEQLLQDPELCSPVVKARTCDPELKKGHTYIQWMIALVANITLFTYGLQTGWISPMTKVLQSAESPTGVPLTNNEISWIASTICIAAVAGVPIYTYIVDAYGRRIGLIAISAPQALCWIIKLLPSSTTSLIIARVFSGIAAGGCFNVVPMYVKEISQDNIRGILGSLVVLLQNMGLLCMYAIGAYLDYNTVLYLVVAIPIINMILLIKAPESPAYLVKIGEFEQATATIACLRGLDVDDNAVGNEVKALQDAQEYYKTLPDISFRSIFTVPAWHRTFWVLMILMTVRALNGALPIITYASTLLSMAGVTFNPELQTLSFPVFMSLGSIISMNVIERIGRKPVIVSCFLATALTMILLSTALILTMNGYNIPSWLTVVCMIIIVTAFAGGVSSIPYILMTEMFNFQIRAKASGVLVIFAWFVAFVQLVTFSSFANSLGLYNTFYIFAGINLIGFFVCVFFLPETKAKTVEEIEKIMSRKPATDNSFSLGKLDS